MTGAPGSLLWEPSAECRERARITHYLAWLKRERGLAFDGYEALWRWSVTEIEGFWASLWEYFEVDADEPYERVLTERVMPGAEWFPGARLNYAQHVLRHGAGRGGEVAVVHRSELRGHSEITWDDLEVGVRRVAAALRDMGVGRGDRVVAYMPNLPETLMAFLAAASVGATWSSCSPDFGAQSVLDRFQQTEPKVLFAVDGYRYGGRDFERLDVVERLRREIPTLEHTVVLPYLSSEPDLDRLEGAVLRWDELPAAAVSGPLSFEPLPFDHPLWILYSSGTTGLPKAIVHGQGGILLEHLKQHALHLDLGESDRLFWFTTTGWMMWNYLVGGLLVGASIVLYDGSPAAPDMHALWELAEEGGVTCFGTSASYIDACMADGVEPGAEHDLSRMESLGSTGSPLSSDGFAWVYEHVKSDLWLASVSGGTDMCTAFVSGCPLLPVRTGELQCRALGSKVEAYDEDGRGVVDEVGELVITEPMPSMPIYFWNDAGGERYRGSYFDTFPGVWRHGDWIRITDRGTAVIYGRSDATINRGGIRMGTSEIYSAVHRVEQVADALVVDLETSDGRAYMPLFVVLEEGAKLTDELKQEINRRIREDASPRHVPNEIHVIAEVPRTLNGKTLEVPVKRILSGTPREQAANPESLANPGALDFFVELSERL